MVPGGQRKNSQSVTWSVRKQGWVHCCTCLRLRSCPAIISTHTRLSFNGLFVTSPNDDLPLTTEASAMATVHKAKGGNFFRYAGLRWSGRRWQIWEDEWTTSRWEKRYDGSSPARQAREKGRSVPHRRQTNTTVMRKLSKILLSNHEK